VRVRAVIVLSITCCIMVVTRNAQSDTGRVESVTIPEDAAMILCPIDNPWFVVRSIKSPVVEGWGYEKMDELLITGMIGGIAGYQEGTLLTLFVNLHDSGDRGEFAYDQSFPGIDFFEWPTTDPADYDDDDYFATEVLGCIYLSKGVHTIGINSDDGAIIEVGCVEVGRTAEWKQASTIDFTFTTVVDGYYFLRVRSLEGAGGASLELHEVLADSRRILLNDRAAGGSPVFAAYKLRLLASNPSPADNSIFATTTLTFSWNPGDCPGKHNVYFGTGPANLPLVSRLQDANSYGPLILDEGKHFWRVDEVQVCNSKTQIGNIWSFTIDLTPPHIVRHTPNGDIAGTIDHVEVFFNEAISEETFTLEDVNIISPHGTPITPSSITPLTNSRYEISFPAQTDFGQYVVAVGPNITDIAGNLLDQNGNGISGEEPNDIYQATFNLVDVDLTISNVKVDPNKLWAGEEVTISWNGSNQSGMPLLGEWTDAVYLSGDDQWDIDDKLIATVTHTGGLAQDEVYSGAINAAVPGALPGGYYIIVRADLYNQEKEGADEGNNVVAVGPFSLDVRQIIPGGEPASSTLTETDFADYYKVDIGEGEYLELILDDLAVIAKAEVFVSYEAIPTRLKNDHRSAVGIQDRQQVGIPTGPGGTYYVLVYGERLDGLSPYSLTAEALEIIITDISPNCHGNDRVCTMTISGGGFDNDTTVKFIGSDSSERTPIETKLLSPTTIVVTLDTQNWPIDVYDVMVSKSGADSYEVSDAFTVNTGQANLETNLVVPSQMGRSWRQTIWIEYANTGDSSMPAPLLKLDGTEDDAMLTLDPSLPGMRTNTPPPVVSNTIQVMATGSGATPGILQPGDSGRIPVYFLGLKEPWDWSKWSIEFELGVLEANETDVIDWATLKDDMQPEWMQSDAWDAIWLNFTDQVGSTWGDYVAMFGENMTYLSQAGVKTNDVIQLLAFEFRQADSLCPVRYLTEATDTAIYIPSGQLEFTRVYAQPISRRYELGPLGRGWAHLWQLNLQKTQDGIVKIFNATGTPRVFLPNGQGGYTAKQGDTGILIEVAGVSFTLKEKDGLLIVFHSDGKLDFVEDRNRNRITAGYNGDLLTSLTHSNRKQLLFEYNPDGRIWHIINPRGTSPDDDHVITYEYDASGEYLLTVTAPGNHRTTYTYEAAGTQQQRHALLSIEYPDGRDDYFSYDAQGRLIETHKNSGAESVKYSYDSAGTVTVEDATGRYTVTCFGVAGHALRIYDGESNVTSLEYDSNYQLTGLIGGGGQHYGYSYDDQGEIVGIDDPLHNLTTLIYEPVYKRLIWLRDARRHGIQSGYDTYGNLTSIKYEDGRNESLTYDDVGNVLTWTNRRGDTVIYTYNTQGQPTSKDYSNTPEPNDYTYTYDDAGNLISATDPCGTTILTYDPNTDWLTRIDYPSDHFFTFEYDAVGRRTKRTDQDGNSVNYIYGYVGRLDRTTEGNDVFIVDYDYDAAGRLIHKTLGNGVYTTYEYDNAGRLTHLINHAPNDAVISRFDYTYNSSGRRTSMTTLEGTYTYGYDPLGQLVSVTYPNNRIVEYGYDAVGNRMEVVDNGVSIPYTTNNVNQYTDVNGVIYTYDADGNMKTKTEGSVTTTYSYDIENRLIGVSTPNNNWTYSYDAFGNRIASTHNGVTTHYIVDPIGLGKVVAEYDSNDTLFSRYDHGFGLISRIDDAGTAAYYSFDAIGSTSEMTDAAGHIVNSYGYDPFGNVQIISEPVNNPFRYIGEYGVMSNENKLYFMRARFYSPSIGRFISIDPIRLYDEQTNLYVYVRNNPLTFIDPSGEKISCGFVAPGESPTHSFGLFLGSSVAASFGLSLGVITGLSAGASLGGGVGLSHNVGLKWSTTDPTGLFPADYGYQLGASLLDVSLGVFGGLSFGYIHGGFNGMSLGWSHGLSGGWFCGWSEDPPPVPNEPRTNDGGSGSGRIPRPACDPDKKIGPAGFSKANFVQAGETLSYHIQFENMSDAGSPAHKIIITDELDEDLDVNTLELTEIAFANRTIIVPKGLSYYHATMDIVVDNECVSETTIRVDIDVSLDIDSRMLTCTLMGIDPNTGWLPEDIMLGILYPNDETGRGNGHISFNIKPVEGLPIGNEITNQASIYFDWNDPIKTQIVTNTIGAANLVYGDITGNGKVDFEDLARITTFWLDNEFLADIAPEPDGDGIVNFLDYAKVAEYWLKGVE